MKIESVALYFLPVSMRVPLKFGNQVLDSVTCARVKVTVSDAGETAEGWGETPLSVGWVWPSTIDYEVRHEALKAFTIELARFVANDDVVGHAFEIGHDLIERGLPNVQAAFNQTRPDEQHLPQLAALVCLSPFDLALHDAFGNLHQRPTYQTYNSNWMRHDLGHYLTPDAEGVDFHGRYPEDFLIFDEGEQPSAELPVWHLVGGLDPIEESELTGDEPEDDYPVLLRDWIEADGLDCLKVKLRGNDFDWDFDRLCHIGQICDQENVTWLTTDFNCMVTDPQYVNQILDRLRDQRPLTYQKILYVEQPFPHDLEANQIDVHSVSARKPLLMDESAHDWRLVRMGRRLGWTGVALKTCKTQTGALLSLCWAKAHGMSLMVQDLTNPMLAQIPHYLLAAHAGTMMGVESNGMQFYPEASAAERQVHPGLYRRVNGKLSGATLGKTGFGYRVDQIQRELPPAVFESN